MERWENVFTQVDAYRFMIPKSFKKGMRVNGMIYSSEKMIEHIFQDKSYEQVANVACLPGIVGDSLAMPDIHFGYGFAIGGVAAFDVMYDGIISPGGVGYDINCGVRLLRTNLNQEEVQPKIEKLLDELVRNVPSGVGSTGPITLSSSDMEKVLLKGAQWAVEQGYGEEADILHTEENGAMPEAEARHISDQAKQRGTDQLGTLGSGNHFIEVQVIDEIFDEEVAAAFGLRKGQIAIEVHSGSRGLGHQVCTDYVKLMHMAARKYDIELPDRQLACAPFKSPEGQQYYSSMSAAANYAWCNRQLLMHWARESFAKVMDASAESLGISLLYDVAHNIAKKEEYTVGVKNRLLCVHRKGATRAFPAGHPDIPKDYKHVGQPVLIPGDMGRYSYVMVGTDLAIKETWGSVCHGAGRLMSRYDAAKKFSVSKLINELKKQGVSVRCATTSGLAEEASMAYKDVQDVVDVVHNAGLAKKVARMRPIGVVKG